MVSSNSPSLRILIIEDDPLMQLGLQHALSHYPNFEVVGQEMEGDAGVSSALTQRFTTWMIC